MYEKSILAEDLGIIYEILKEEDFEQTVNLIAEDFSKAEPMTKYLKITSEEFHYFAEIYCKKAVIDGLSIVAKDKNNVIGVLICEDLESDPPIGIEKINIKFNPIMALLNALDQEYLKLYKKKDDKIFHRFMAGVDEKYKNRHIYTSMLEESIKLAKLKNFSVSVGEATGLETQHVLRDKFGFNEKIKIEYKTFMYEGNNVFKNLEFPDFCILMEKRL